MIVQERIKQDVKLITLPNVFIEEDRGYKVCCEPELVLASGTNDTWKNDITAAWVKLYSSSDTVTFKLKDENGNDTTYQPATNNFANDLYSKYCEVQWKSVLAAEGIGCYSIEVEYEISGITGAFTWGRYHLRNYSIDIANGTARFRAVWNHYNEIEDINFSGSNVQGTIRFKGYIGSRQPNKEVNNLIYSNREVRSVVRENLNTWEFETDPMKEQYTRMICDLFLLSEVQLFASDYNDFNHSYNINDIPVIIEESEQIEYLEFFRGAIVKGKLGDKFKNKRAIYR